MAEAQPAAPEPQKKKQKKDEVWPEIKSFGDLLSFVADLARDLVEAVKHARRGVDNLVRRRKRDEG